MIGLPGELREYLTIWAIGSILGVTKDVDMKSLENLIGLVSKFLFLTPT
jgi:hypothetical protein